MENILLLSLVVLSGFVKKYRKIKTRMKKAAAENQQLPVNYSVKWFESRLFYFREVLFCCFYNNTAQADDTD